MSDVDSLINGLEIFKKYGKVSIAAEHEEIYAGPEGDHEISVEDKLSLESLGWIDSGDMGWLLFV